MRMLNWFKKKNKVKNEDINLAFNISKDGQIKLSVSWPKPTSDIDSGRICLDLSSLLISLHEEICLQHILDEIAKFAMIQGDEDIYTTVEHYVVNNVNKVCVRADEVFKGIGNAPKDESGSGNSN